MSRQEYWFALADARCESAMKATPSALASTAQVSPPGREPSSRSINAALAGPSLPLTITVGMFASGVTCARTPV